MLGSNVVEIGSNFQPAPIKFKFNRNDPHDTLDTLNLLSRSRSKFNWGQIFKMLQLCSNLTGMILITF